MFVLAAIVLEFVRGTRARKALGARWWPGAFSSLVARNRRRYGGYVVHAAIVLLAIGVAGSSAYGATIKGTARPGESMAIRGYTVDVLSAARPSAGRRNHDEIRARLAVSATASRSDDHGRGQEPYPFDEHRRSRTRSRSAPTGCAPRICS